MNVDLVFARPLMLEKVSFPSSRSVEAKSSLNEVLNLAN